MPVVVIPAPARLTFETVTLEPPVLVMVTGRVSLPLVDTFPKFRLVVLGPSCPGAGVLTVNVAVLLVVLPAELLTTTVNCAPLSDVAVAGVV
jgi:hypothetical protein